MMISLKVFFWTSIFWIFLIIMGRGFLRFFDTNFEILAIIFPHIQSKQCSNETKSDTLTLSGIVTSQIDTLRNDIIAELDTMKNTLQTIQNMFQQASQPSLQTQPSHPTITPPIITTGGRESMTDNLTQSGTGGSE